MATALLAYIDPGSGTLLLQTILAGVFSGVFTFRRGLWRFCTWPWRRLRSVGRE